MPYFVLAFIEIVALAIAMLLYHYGVVAWYFIPLSLLIPLVIAFIVIAVAFFGSVNNGENPFQ